MYPSTWLSKEDCRIPLHATIKQVTQEEIKGEGGKELKNVIHFMGSVKSLILNKGNASILCDLFGDDSNQWHGEQIEIYVDANVMFGGKRVGGLRVRAPSQSPAQSHQHSNGAVWSYAQALGECVKAGITKDNLVAELKRQGQTAWNDAKCTPIAQQLIDQVQNAAGQNFDADPVGAGSDNIPF